MALPATDAFTSGSNQSLTSYSASWTIGMGAFNVHTAGHVAGAAAGADSMAFWNADAFNAAQYSKVQTATGWVAAARPFIGPAVRCSSTGGGAGYGVEFGGGNEWYLGRIVGASWTTVRDHTTGGAMTVADGDWVMLEVTTPDANTVRVVLKHAAAATPNTFTTISTFDDTNANRLLSGSGGIAGYDNTSSPAATNFEAGNLATPTSPGGAIVTVIGLGM